MMDAPWTAVHDTPNKSIRQNVARRGVILHGAAMTSLDGLRRLAMGAKQVSATAITKDGAREKMMGDAYRPWSMSSAYWDSACRSSETCNESVDGWTFSDATLWSLAYEVAYWSEVDGFWPHRDGDRSTWTVYGHREIYEEFGDSYATACPQSMDLDLVTKRAQGLRMGSTITTKNRSNDMPSWNVYTRDDNLAIAYGWSDPLDGIMNKAWIEVPPSALIEAELYNPTRISNKVWNHRSNAANRLASITAVNAALLQAGRPALYLPTASVPGGGATVEEVQRIVSDELAKQPTKIVGTLTP